MQHSFELAPTRGSSLGDGEELWMEWAGRGLSGTVAEGGGRGEIVGSDRRGLVVGFRSRTKTARGWCVGVDESRARAGEGQQGRMLRKGQVQMGSQKDKFGLGAS